MKTFKISQGAGDIISSIPYIKELGGAFGYLVINHPIVPDWHPMNHGGANALLPLLKSQGLDGCVIDYKDQYLYSFDINMDARVEQNWPGYLGDILTWNSYFYGVYPDMTKPFIHVEEQEKKDFMAFSFTPRYSNLEVDISALANYDIKKIMLGTEAEYHWLTETRPDFAKNVEFVKTNDFLEAAKIMLQARFYVSNQTGLFQLAEGLGINRLLIVCKQFPSVVLKTPNGRGVIRQDFFLKNVEYFINKTI